MLVCQAFFVPTHRTACPLAASRRDPGHIDEPCEEGGDDRAVSILRDGYARGEIPPEEYERRVEPLVTHEPARNRR